MSPTARRISRPPAPEIWEQTQGKVDGFVSAVGSGGTLGGVSMALKAKNPEYPDRPRRPRGRGALQLLHHRRAEELGQGSSITEGIGQGRITANLKDIVVDRAYQIPDSEALPYVFDLLEHEGLCLGGSSGINIAGAVRLARDLGPGKTIVTILADYGNRYQSKLFNPEFLRSKNLPVPHWLEARTPIDWQSVVEAEPVA
jgi:cysteine synthase A